MLNKAQRRLYNALQEAISDHAATEEATGEGTSIGDVCCVLQVLDDRYQRLAEETCDLGYGAQPPDEDDDDDDGIKFKVGGKR